MKQLILYVSPDGSDRNNGLSPHAAKKGNDGPFKSIQRAINAARSLRKATSLASAIIQLRGGIYYQKKPIVIRPKDSGKRWKRRSIQIRNQTETVLCEAQQEQPLRIGSYRGEQATISGGVQIKGWKETTVHGKRAWVASVPAAKNGWNFRQLFVNSERRQRTRYPSKGTLQIERLDKPLKKLVWYSGQDTFYYKKGDLKKWRNLTDIEIVFIINWLDERVGMKSIDEKKRKVVLLRKTYTRLGEDFPRQACCHYYAENVFECLREPGQWYLDRSGAKLYYLPLASETIETTEIIAPRLSSLVRFEGEGAQGEFIESVQFNNCSFAHTEWFHPADANSLERGQGAPEAPGAIVMSGARSCSFTHCTFTLLGTYAIECNDNTQDCEVSHCSFYSLGGGGVKAWHGCRRLTVADNEMEKLGQQFKTSCGVLLGRCSGNKIIHNHIHDLFYSGISAGWTWGYHDWSDAYGNVIEHNHIHNAGHGELSDLGAVYTLGLSGGTRIRFNKIHDITSRNYGGWGIYLDEGSSDILVENNVVFNCDSSPFHQNFGKDNIIQNNIFAFGGRFQFMQTDSDPHLMFIVRNNIFYFDSGEVLGGNNYDQFMMGRWTKDNIRFENNIYFSINGKQPTYLGNTLAKWQKMGFEQGSIIADPRFVNAEKYDFRLKKNSIARKLGFREFSMDEVGIRMK